MPSHDRMESRWHPDLARFGITQGKWRRHSKLLSLTRAHSWLVALDDHIIKAFEDLCASSADTYSGPCFSGKVSWFEGASQKSKLCAESMAHVPQTADIGRL